jgi:hypothetical protein
MDHHFLIAIDQPRHALARTARLVDSRSRFIETATLIEYATENGGVGGLVRAGFRYCPGWGDEPGVAGSAL